MSNEEQESITEEPTVDHAADVIEGLKPRPPRRSPSVIPPWLWPKMNR